VALRFKKIKKERQCELRITDVTSIISSPDF